MGQQAADGYVAFPEIYLRKVLAEKYRNIPMEDDTTKLLRQYFCAMANLYGVVPLRKAYEIIQSQNPGLVTEEQFLLFAEVARHERENYYILGVDEIYSNAPSTHPLDREIIDCSLFGDDSEPYVEMIRSHQGKPYYVPEKAVFLRYRNESYCEPTPQARTMKAFLHEICGENQRFEKHIFSDILFVIRSLHLGISDVLEQFENNSPHMTEEKLDQFIRIYNDFHNHTSMPCNRGFSPDEIMEMTPPEDRIPKSFSFGPNIRKSIQDGTMSAQDLARQIMGMELPNEELRFSMLKELAEIAPLPKPPQKQKIGRNELCPCGSGKKYKHCCGR